MDLWQKARTFAEEAARRSQELTKEAAKRSSEITVGSSKLSDIVSEASKRSKEIAAEASKRSKEFATEASKRADQIRLEAAKRADAIKSLAENISLSETMRKEEEDLERFGVTEELREFVQQITLSTFRDFPLQDDSEVSDIPTESNVRKDLNEWQVKHASLVLSTVKVKGVMKSFISTLDFVINNQISLHSQQPLESAGENLGKLFPLALLQYGWDKNSEHYEKRHMENVKLKSLEQGNDAGAKEPSTVEINPKSEAKDSNQPSKASMSSATEQDLDVFLLGEDSDDDPDGGDGEFDDDLDKMDSSDDEKEKPQKISEVDK
ncbi:BSD domain-containing protein [Citrus sinensis]|uniref:BSD domain-containing protein n=1 Tax=Citrus sinensis TaxID=2711 RepID=A0ACB8LYS9_CITSI|nr:BSD domain-containing protein [Citrus sinensis]